MTGSRIVTSVIWVAILVFVALAAPASAGAEELIAGGDFESGALAEGRRTVSHDGWTANILAGEGTVTLVDSPVLSGGNAVEIDSRASSFGRFIYQDIVQATGCFTWIFNVYPGEGKHVAEIIYSWRGDNGPTKIITVLGYDESGITFNAWDASDSLSTVLSPGEWHEVTVEADSDQKTQKLLIDGEQVAELTAVNADAVADTMIIGDVAGQAFQALHTYDDVSLDTHACSGAPAQETDSPVASGAAPVISEKDGGAFPWWIIVVIVIVGAIVAVFFWRRRRSRPAE